MSTHFTLAAGLLVGTFLLPLAPAQANGTVQWSVTIGTPVYPVYPPPGVVVYPQSNYIYGAPPSAFAPPPPVIYVPPQPYVQVYPAYPPPDVIVYPPPVVIRRDWSSLRHEHEHRGWEERNRWGERHEGRRW